MGGCSPRRMLDLTLSEARKELEVLGPREGRRAIMGRKGKKGTIL